MTGADFQASNIVWCLVACLAPCLSPCLTHAQQLLTDEWSTLGNDSAGAIMESQATFEETRDPQKAVIPASDMVGSIRILPWHPGMSSPGFGPESDPGQTPTSGLDAFRG